MVAAILRKWGYEVVLAGDGVEAWDIVQRESIQFVISDWLMPRMNGLELCRRVRAADFSHYVYLILLTGLDDRRSLVEGMEAGADDFLVKPLHPEELRVRIRAGSRVLELERNLEERNRRLVEAHRELMTTYTTVRKDLEAAAAMQKALLPAPAIRHGFTLDWLFRPSHVVAGDMFGYFPLGAGHLGFYQLDVAGHGVPAALLSFMLNKVLSQSAREEGILMRSGGGIVPPGSVVAELNQRFEADPDVMVYFTMVYGVVEVESGRVSFTQAGHPPPIRVRAGEARTVGRGGFPVGMLADVDYETTTLHLQKGDRLFLYSDGITDCESPQGERFSESRLLKVLERGAGHPLSRVNQAVGDALRDWKENEEYQDDVTLLALERT